VRAYERGLNGRILLVSQFVAVHNGVERSMSLRTSFVIGPQTQIETSVIELAERSNGNLNIFNPATRVLTKTY
jgi:hypothetical protein